MVGEVIYKARRSEGGRKYVGLQVIGKLFLEGLEYRAGRIASECAG